MTKPEANPYREATAGYNDAWFRSQAVLRNDSTRAWCRDVRGGNCAPDDGKT